MSDNGAGESEVPVSCSSLVSPPAFPTLSRLVPEVACVDEPSLRHFSTGGYRVILREVGHAHPVLEKDSFTITLLHPVVVSGHKICVELYGSSGIHGVDSL